MRLSEFYSQDTMDEMLRIYRLNPQWLRIGHKYRDGQDVNYVSTSVRVDSWLLQGIKGDSSEQLIATYMSSQWLGEGPKVFCPSREQSEIMRHVNVNLDVEDITLPYPVVLVEASVPPFRYAMLSKLQGDKCSVLGVDLFGQESKGHYNICTVIQSGSFVESTLSTTEVVGDYIPENSDDQSRKEMTRIAINCCLALSNYGCHMDYLYPKEVASDQRLAKENTERGERARKRLSLAVQKLSFSQDVKLHRTEHKPRDPSDPTGVEMPPHWRRGHWAMQTHGPHNSLRKRIFRPPVLVRSDLLIGEKSDTSVTYH